MKRFLCGIYLKIIGWKITAPVPDAIKKCVMIVAPHTSNLDFIIGRAAFYKMGLKNVKFLIKKESFKFPMGWLLKALGALPVDRSKGNNTINESISLFTKYDPLYLLITPEGTRKRVENWKKGFYHIAQSVHVPVVLIYIDYSKKEGGYGGVLYPSGNFDDDFKIITDFYRGKRGKNPENFNL